MDFNDETIDALLDTIEEKVAYVRGEELPFTPEHDCAMCGEC